MARIPLLVGSANWKERKEALDGVEEALTGAGMRIQPGLTDLVGELKKRLADSNKNLVIQVRGGRRLLLAASSHCFPRVPAMRRVRPGQMQPWPNEHRSLRTSSFFAPLPPPHASPVIQTLGIMGKLATAMGRAWGREGRPLLSPALKCLQDPKAAVSDGPGRTGATKKTLGGGESGATDCITRAHSTTPS